MVVTTQARGLPENPLPRAAVDSILQSPVLCPVLPTPMRLRHALHALALAALIGGVAPVEAAVPVLGSPAAAVDEASPPLRLSAPRPNPFSASTRLELTVDEPSEVTVAVFDALGRRVAVLHEGPLRASTYTLRVDAGDLPPGLYLVRATDGRGATATRSVALVR